MLLLSSADFKIDLFFSKIFQKLHQCVQPVGPDLDHLKLLAKDISRRLGKMLRALDKRFFCDFWFFKFLSPVDFETTKNEIGLPSYFGQINP